MKTITHLEAFRFLVSSKTNSQREYLVDLEEWNGNGECSCPHFQFRIKPRLAKGEQPEDWSICYHIARAHRSIVTDSVQKVVKLRKVEDKRRIAQVAQRLKHELQQAY